MKKPTKQALLKGVKLLKKNPSKFISRLINFFTTEKIEIPQRFKMNLMEWFAHHNTNLGHCTWMGIRTIKNPLDSWIYQEIIHETKPEIIIEIGSLYGGSTLYLAQLLELIGKGKVISIDINRNLFSAKHNRIITITGDSSSQKVISKVSEICQNKQVLVIQDGGHTKEQVLKDLNTYWKFVSLNSYFIVEDSLIDISNPGKGPLAAIETFLSNNNKFIIDTKRERYILTYNQKGFLKRIK